MDRIFPSWDILETQTEPYSDEIKLLSKFFDDNLPKSWKIFVKPFFNGSHPDIILINPNIGFMIYSVHNDIQHTNPYQIIKKLNYYRNKIIQDLIPEIGERIDENIHFLSLIQTGVYINNLSGFEARKKFNNKRYPVVIGNDDLNHEKLGRIIRGYNENNNHMESKWADELEFWLKPPVHKEKRTEITLTKKQQDLSKPVNGHHRILGVAGSGKSVIIAYRAAELARRGKKVLLLTFNRTLVPYIKELVDNTAVNFDWSYITFRHFHGFCFDFLHEMGDPIPIGKGKNYDEYLKELIIKVDESFQKAPFDLKKKYIYDAILIDEGQDCNWESYNLLRTNFLSERNELLLACDYNQNIFNREQWIHQMKATKGDVEFRGPWIELNTIHRFSDKIANIAKEFSKKFDQENQYMEVDHTQLKLISDQNEVVKWKNIDYESWIKELIHSYEFLKEINRNLKQSEIGILVPKKDLGLYAVNCFEQRNIPVNHLYEKETDVYGRNKKSFNKDDDRLKICTVHNFKGWETSSIILLIPNHWNGTSSNLDSVVYTAMTRAQKNLIILNTHDRYWDFGDEFEQNNQKTRPEHESDEIKVSDRISNFKGFPDIIRTNLENSVSYKDTFINYAPDICQLLTDLLGEDLGIDSNNKINEALVYFINPMDVIPEALIGSEGYIDDIYLASYVLYEIGENHGFELLRKFWKGEDDLEEVINECYTKSEEYLGKKTQDVLKYAPQLRNKVRLEELLEKGENKNIEFKSSLRYDYNNKKPNKSLEIAVSKTLAGFMNTKGGWLLIGVEDNKNICGIENDYKTMNKRQNKDGFQQRLSQIIETSIGLKYMNNLDIKFAKKDNKTICIINVKKRSKEPVFLKMKGKEEQFYIRVASTTKPLKTKETVDYIKNTWK